MLQHGTIKLHYCAEIFTSFSSVVQLFGKMVTSYSTNQIILFSLAYFNFFHQGHYLSLVACSWAAVDLLLSVFHSAPTAAGADPSSGNLYLETLLVHTTNASKCCCCWGCRRRAKAYLLLTTCPTMFSYIFHRNHMGCIIIPILLRRPLRFERLRKFA